MRADRALLKMARALLFRHGYCFGSAHPNVTAVNTRSFDQLGFEPREAARPLLCSLIDSSLLYVVYLATYDSVVYVVYLTIYVVYLVIYVEYLMMYDSG